MEEPQEAPSVAAIPPPPTIGAYAPQGLQLADKGVRAAGYVIDVIPACLLGLFGMIPILGPIIAGLLLVPYWLLRDITGSSLGKLALGTRVVRSDGSPAPIGSRIIRNIPIAIGPALLIIPLLGYILALPVGILMFLTEVIMLLTQGNRLGDRLAGTTVVKR